LVRKDATIHGYYYVYRRGEHRFCKKLVGDILSFPELSNATIRLFDIDMERLEDPRKSSPTRSPKPSAPNPPSSPLPTAKKPSKGRHYAIAMFQVGGYKPSTVIDFDIPKRYGLRQTIADTLGIGGIMRGLRTIPVMLDMCRDMEQVAGDITFLNYVNPMAMNCSAVSRATPITTVGLCHSVQGTAEQLSR
jgi:alpha-galactosidase